MNNVHDQRGSASGDHSDPGRDRNLLAHDGEGIEDRLAPSAMRIADLGTALAHDIRDHSVDSDTSEKKRRRREGDEEGHREARGSDGAPDDILEAANLGKGDLGVDAAHNRLHLGNQSFRLDGCSNREGHRRGSETMGVLCCRKRDEHARLHFGRDSVVPDVADDAYHPAEFRIAATDSDSLSEGALAFEVPSSERLVHDDHRLRVRAIRIGEGASFEKPHSTVSK